MFYPFNWQVLKCKHVRESIFLFIVDGNVKFTALGERNFTVKLKRWVIGCN